jgi:hypothetical protein
VTAYFDDNCDDNPKIAGLSDSAFRLWFRGLLYCRRNRTDGHIPELAARGLTKGAKQYQRASAELLARPTLVPDRVPLWSRTETGFLIHNYLERNKSREQIDNEIAEKREYARRGGLRSGQVRAKQSASASDEHPISDLRSPIYDPLSEGRKSTAVADDAQPKLFEEPRKPPKATRAPSGFHQHVFAYWPEAFERAKGVAALKIGPPEHKAIKRLEEATGGDVELAKRIIDAALESERYPETLLTIARDPARWMHNLPPAASKASATASLTREQREANGKRLDALFADAKAGGDLLAEEHERSWRDAAGSK